MATRILIADDHDAVRAALSQSIRSIDSSSEIYEAEDGQAAIDKAAAVRPDLVILDLRMPPVDGTEAGRAIKKLLPNTAMLTYAFNPPAYLQEAAFENVVDDGIKAMKLIPQLLSAIKVQAQRAVKTIEEATKATEEL